MNTKISNKNQFKMAISWGIVLIWMAIIFSLSHEPAKGSSERSGIIVMFLLGLGFDSGMADLLSTVVRKGAHVTLYLVLAILLYRAWRVSQLTIKRSLILAVCIAIAFAISDEIHQTFIPGRSGEALDVMIDSMGIMFGLLLVRINNRTNLLSDLSRKA